MNKALSKHQIDLLKKSSVSPAQILENLDDLNEEIAETYDVNEAMKLAQADPTFSEPKSTGILTAERIKEPVMSEVIDDREAQLKKEAEEAEKILVTKAKEAREAAQKAASEKQEEAEELSPEDKQRKAVLDVLARTPNAPSEATLAAMKTKYGEHAIHALALGEGDIYIFTYLNRGQWKQIQKVVQAAQASEVGGDPEDILKEKVIAYTVLWPKGVSSPEFLYHSRAGVIDTLYQSILMHSYFLTPQQTMMLTVQL